MHAPTGDERATRQTSETQSSAESSGAAEMETTNDICTVTIQKPDASSRVGLRLGETRDGKWVMVGAVERGSLADRFSELKSGARLTEVCGGGQVYTRPTLQEAAVLLASASGDIRVSFKPLTDRFGFICTMDQFVARVGSRDQVRWH